MLYTQPKRPHRKNTEICAISGCEGRPMAYGFCAYHRPPCEECRKRRFFYDPKIDYWHCAYCTPPRCFNLDPETVTYAGNTEAEEARIERVGAYLDSKYPDVTEASLRELLDLMDGRKVKQ